MQAKSYMSKFAISCIIHIVKCFLHVKDGEEDHETIGRYLWDEIPLEGHHIIRINLVGSIPDATILELNLHSFSAKPSKPRLNSKMAATWIESPL